MYYYYFIMNSFFAFGNVLKRVFLINLGNFSAALSPRYNCIKYKELSVRGTIGKLMFHDLTCWPLTSGIQAKQTHTHTMTNTWVIFIFLWYSTNKHLRRSRFTYIINHNGATEEEASRCSVNTTCQGAVVVILGRSVKQWDMRYSL